MISSTDTAGLTRFCYGKGKRLVRCSSCFALQTIPRTPTAEPSHPPSLSFPTSYPNIGVDDRNQFELIKSLPGGREAVAAAVARFHARGVKVFWPYFRWDEGTASPETPDYQALVSEVVLLDSDGINGDTCDGLNATWFDESVAAGKALALESQSMGSRRYGFSEGWENLTTNVMSWGENWPYTDAPLISAYRIIEPRHMVQIVERFAENRTNGLHHAFFNGIGYETWENIWNMFNLITPRDGEAIRRIRAILLELAETISSDTTKWRPYPPPAQVLEGVFVSQFDNPAMFRNAYLVVNRRARNHRGTEEAFFVECDPGDRVYDMYRGHELTPYELDHACEQKGGAYLKYPLEPHGFGAVLVVRPGGTAPSREYLQRMRMITTAPLSAYSPVRSFLPQTMSPLIRSRGLDGADGMSYIEPPANGAPYDWSCSGNIQQGDSLPTIVDVQFPFETSPRRNHAQKIELEPFWLDTFPVTNGEYLEYLRSSGYRPRDPTNWLRSWPNADRFPTGWANKPVQWISRAEAAAYCEYVEKRLPHTWEWQYAAQGSDGRRFPWGDEPDPDRTPTPSTARVFPILDDVGAHPNGASPFGVEDLLGLVFQWTDTFVDEHTEMTIVRGSSSYIPHEAARYYFPRPANLYEHNTLLTMADSMDRSAGIGFRCAMDASPSPNGPACPWQLCGKPFAEIETGTVIDLTREGALDWIHFGANNALDLSAKVGGGQTVSVAVVGPEIEPELFIPLLYPGLPIVNYLWSDGDDPVQNLGTGRGIFVTSAEPGAGFELTVRPVGGAAAGRILLKLYAAVRLGTGRLMVKSAGGANVYEQSVTAGEKIVKGVFTVEARLVDSWPIAVSWILTTADEVDAVVALFAVTTESLQA